MHFSETHSVFPRQGRTATVICPQCGTARSVQIDTLRVRKGPLKIQCSCGPVFGIMGELRRTWRKNVCVDGRFRACRQKNKAGDMVVKNISTLGIGFVTLTDHDLHLEDTLRIAFTIDSRTPKDVELEAVVRAINGRTIGCEFTEKNQALKTLEKYVNTPK